jgi:hypothetical protein
MRAFAVGADLRRRFLDQGDCLIAFSFLLILGELLNTDGELVRAI